ncbi:MAG: LCP family protein [Firmicutes bacterium]|nr:LCP family protein [Bacillota bacterium]
MSDKVQNRIPTIYIPRKMRVMLKSFLITMLFISVLLLVGVILWSRTVVPPPPTPPGWVQQPQEESSPRTVDDYTTDYDSNTDDYAEPVYAWSAPDRFTGEDRKELFWTFLIVGLNEGLNSNTVMVASYCGISREANLISIPRDVVVHPTRNGRKLISSYLAGIGGDRGRPGGIAQLQWDVMGIIGFIPDYYVIIDYEAFFSIIDAVNGIEVYVPIRMRYDDPCQNLFIDIQPGMQHMDSATALDFVRFRQANRNSGYPSLPDGDFGRTRNQQAVIEAIIDRLLTPASILRIPQFVSIFTESVDTNLTFSEMMYFAHELNHIRGTDALQTYTMLPVRSGGRPHYYEFLGPSNVLELINRTINPFTSDLQLTDLNIITE